MRVLTFRRITGRTSKKALTQPSPASGRGLISLIAFLVIPTLAQADALLDNVNGYTLDAQGQMVRFTGLLLDKDGRITKLLAGKDKPPKKLDYRIDGKGRTMIPGLIAPAERLMPGALAKFTRDPAMASRQIQPHERDVAFAEAQIRYLSRGITTVVDSGTSIVDWNVYRRAGDAGRLRMRILSAADSLETMTTISGNQPTAWLYDGRLRMGGLAVVDKPPLEDTRVRNLMSRATMDGFQVTLLPEGAEGLEHGLAAIEEVALTYTGDRRWRVELGPLPAPPAARLAANKIIAVRPVDETLANLATSFAARTREAAYAVRAEDRIGILAPGYQADFLLFDRDVIALPPAAAAEAKLREAWIGGVRAWAPK